MRMTFLSAGPILAVRQDSLFADYWDSIMASQRACLIGQPDPMSQPILQFRMYSLAKSTTPAPIAGWTHGRNRALRLSAADAMTLAAAKSAS